MCCSPDSAALAQPGASARRLARLRAACSDAGIDAFFVRDTSNIAWLTAFDGVFDEEDAHALLVAPRNAVLHTDSRYAEAARAAASDAPVAVDDSRATHAKFVAEAFAGRRDAESPSAAEAPASSSAAPSGTSAAEAPTSPSANASGTAPAEAPMPSSAAEALAPPFVILSGAAEGGAVEGSPAAPADPAGDEASSLPPERPEASGHLAGPAVLGIEDSIALGEFRALESALAEAPGCGPELRETSRFVLGLRGVKEPSEIVRLRAAQAVTDAAFARIVAFMRPGMTEREVQIELEDFMRRHGAEGLAFPSIVATGANGASPHAVPGDARLEAGQCVVLDFGARACGYCSDMTRTVFLGEPDARLRAAYEAIRAANEQVEAALRPGVTGAAMHELAERVLAEHGFAGKMGHSLGHGVGIDIHEEPNLSPRNPNPLVEGNVVTVEPGIYLPGEFGMRLEDFGVVTHDGFAVFTQSTHDMVII